MASFVRLAGTGNSLERGFAKLVPFISVAASEFVSCVGMGARSSARLEKPSAAPAIAIDETTPSRRVVRMGK